MNDGGQNLRPDLLISVVGGRTRPSLAILIVVLILVSYVGFLLVTNYRSMASLQQTLLGQLTEEIKRRTVTLSHFFVERKDDLDNLAWSTEIAVYYANRALGMSREYGLSQSLIPIKSRFNQLIKQKKLDYQIIYSRMILIDEEGTILVDTLSKKSPSQDINYREFIAPLYQNSTVLIDGKANQIMISRAYYFKEKYAGQLVAWLESRLFDDHLLGHHEASGEILYLAVEEANQLSPLSHTISAPCFASIASLKTVDDGKPFELADCQPDRLTQPMIGLRLRIQDTPLLLFYLVPTKIIYGESTSWHMFLGMVALAVAILAVGILIVHLNVRMMLLQARNQESIIYAQELRDKNERLELEIDGRQRAERALFGAKEAAEAANRAKSEFLAVMSHEIRTPLNGVLGMAELLRETGLNAQQRRFVDTILHSGQALLAVINDILDFSKIEAGRLELESVVFDPRALLEDTTALLAGRAHHKGLELAVDLPVDLPGALHGDPIRLRQILVNLIGNAIKFTEKGEVVIRLRLLEQDVQTARLRMAVSDTGIGIHPGVQARIFESFTQADGSTTRRFGGTGLGLAISKRLVGLMGGELTVESAPGVGSTFGFTLTLACAEAVSRPTGTPRLDPRDARVLVVDDNATNREILHRQVSGWGMREAGVASGAEALAVLRQATQAGAAYDLAILDWRMPEMDGLELARQIRADPVLNGLRLLMLTSSDPSDGGPHSMVAGIDGYLSKPVRQAELHDALRRLARPAVADMDPASHHTLPLGTASRLNAQVLVAEDNPVNQEVAVAMLEPLGCQVTVAADGHEALAALERQSFDLVLMDCQMPVLDGFAATTAWRQRESAAGHRRIPIIALTADVMKGMRERCQAMGMDDYLSKPFERAQLVAVLQRWLPVSIPSDAAPTSPVADTVASTAATPPATPPPTALDPADSPLDECALAQIRALRRPGQPSVLGKVIGLYLDSAPALLQQLRAAVEAGDGEALRQVAHSLKSSSANLGATQLAACCKELEQRGRDWCLEGVAALLAEVDGHYGRVREALIAEMEKNAREAG